MSAHRIVIVGAGFSGVYAYRTLHRLLHGRKGVHLTLISSSNYFLFTPLLHEVATGGIAPENIIQPLRDVIGCCVDEFIRADAEKVSFKKKQVATAAGPIAYDTLVLAVGAETNFMNVIGAEAECFQLKSLSDAVRLKNHVIDMVETAARETNTKKRKALLTFAIVGGGATGIELACELSDFVHKTLSRYFPGKEISRNAKIILLQAAAELVPNFPSPLRAISHAVCEEKKIDVRLNAKVARVEKGAVILANGDRIETATPVWVAGVKARHIPCDDEKTKHENGAFRVTPELRLERYPNVFVLGDCAIVESAPVPCSAQVAVQEAKTAAENIVRSLNGEALRPFRYINSGVLLSLGDYHAAGMIGNLVFSGPFCWWLWRTVYLFKMPTFQKKMKVALVWTFDLFLPRDVSKIE